MSDVVLHLENLIERYQATYDEHGLLPQTDYMEEWDAPCYVGEVKYGEIGWRACKQEPPLDFSGIEKGLGLELNSDVADFFSTFYAGDLHLSYRGHDFTLLQVIHSEDGERLQRNIVGHVLMKQRLQQDITVFIGVEAEHEDLIISVDNITGVVGLEYAGKDHHEKLANSLSELLAGALPRVVNGD